MEGRPMDGRQPWLVDEKKLGTELRREAGGQEGHRRRHPIRVYHPGTVFCAGRKATP